MDNENSPYGWVAASEVRERLLAAGVGEVDLLGTVAWACEHGRLLATGFTDQHIRDEHHSGIERQRTSQGRLWLVLWRTDPRFKGIDSERKQGFGRIARWGSGEFAWTLNSDGEHMQESWRVVLFDRPSFEVWVREVESRRAANVAQDDEIASFIAACDATNYKTGWKLFTAAFGARAGKQEAFLCQWRGVKGPRGRGRPRKIA